MPYRRIVFLAIVALTIVAFVPTAAFGVLVNEYGMTFAGAKTTTTGCLACHEGSYGQTVHGRFAKAGLIPDAPADWTIFRAAGDATTVGSASPGSGAPWFTAGGFYSVADLTWMTLGDFEGGAATEYLFWNGNETASNKNPWNLVEGLVAEPNGEWMVGEGGDSLYDVVYSCQRCHQLGTTSPTPNAASTAAVPNPAATKAATATTEWQWARLEGDTAAEFKTDPTVSYAGMSIQCEACHGTGFKSATDTTKHWNSGTQLSHRIPAAGAQQPGGGTLPGTDVTDLLDSRVCGQCHGSYTNVAGTLGIYGYTPNLPLWKFGDINGVSGGASYTYTPTEAEFMAAPTKYFLFPNGSNARGNHYYYNEWATSGHAYRGALGTSMGANPDVLPGGTDGHFNPKTSAVSCGYCHTGEGYLWSKDAPIMAEFTPTADNTGYMGQECVVCHSPHPSGVGASDVIRQPDGPGERSNAGTTNTNASVCEDCHNWQREVQDLGPLVPITSGRVSHPQREMLHGRSVMFEVPDMGEFMPNAKCEECHMPKTNRSANRFSHGMHIMEPGDAEKWMTAASASYAAGYNGEDSCSNCHPGLTRTELQEYLDGWQEDAIATAADANAAITAAKLLPEYGTDAGKDLVGRAYVNHNAFTNDASSGAHNPPYVMAGLKAAVRLAKSVGGKIDLVAPETVGSNAVFGVAGKTSNGDGSAAAGAKVEFWVGGVKQGTATTDENGNFAFMSAQTSAKTYMVKWIRSSNSISALSKSVTVNMTPAAKIETEMFAGTGGKSTATAGTSYKVYGRIDPAFAGASIQWSYKLPNSSTWVLYTTTSTGADGKCNFVKNVTSGTTKGLWQWRGKFAGDATYLGSSGATQITVK